MSLVSIQDASRSRSRRPRGRVAVAFLPVVGTLVSGLGVRHMLKERRASTGDLAAVVSLVFLGAILLTSGKTFCPALGMPRPGDPVVAAHSPGGWPKRKNFYNAVVRGRSLPASSFRVPCWRCCEKATARPIAPEPANALPAAAGVLAVGVASWPALKKTPAYV